jgi:fucose permease
MTPRVGPLTAASFSGMFVFGIVMAVIGALLPTLAIGYAQGGNLLLMLTATMLVSMLALGPVMDRYGKRLPLGIGALLVALALAGMALWRGYDALLASVALLGIGGGALNGGTNTLISDLHPDPRRKNSALNLLGTFFGFGALFLPFVIGSLVERLGLAAILWAAAALTLLVAAVFLGLPFPPAKYGGAVRFSEIGRVARNPLVLAFGFVLFCQSGNEFLIGGYTSKYLTDDLKLPFETASYLLAAYWAAIMLARAVSSRLLLKTKGPGVVLLSAAGSAAAIVLLALAHSALGAAFAMVLMGVSFASIYPTILGQAGARFPEHSGTVFGLLFAIGLAGGMLLPWTAGHLAETFGLRIAFTLAVFAAAAIFVLQLAIARRNRAEGS